MASKYLDLLGFMDFARKVKVALSKKVDKVDGMGLSQTSFTANEKNKLSGIAEGADANVINSIKVDNIALDVTNKSVNIDLSNKVDKVSGMGLSQNSYSSSEKEKLSNIENRAQVNIIEGINVNGVSAQVSNKVATISFDIPQVVSDLANDSGYQNANQVMLSINSEIVPIPESEIISIWNS